MSQNKFNTYCGSVSQNKSSTVRIIMRYRPWIGSAMKSGTDTMSSVPSELYRPVFFFYFSFFRLLFFLSFGHSFTRVSSNSFHFDASRFLFLRVKSRVFTKERGIGKNSVHVSALSYLLSCSSSWNVKCSNRRAIMTRICRTDVWSRIEDKKDKRTKI